MVELGWEKAALVNRAHRVKISIINMMLGATTDLDMMKLEVAVIQVENSNQYSTLADEMQGCGKNMKKC